MSAFGHERWYTYSRPKTASKKPRRIETDSSSCWELVAQIDSAGRVVWYRHTNVMEIRSTMQTRKSGVVPVVYRDADSLAEIGNRTAHGVHAFCFVGNQLVIVYSEGKGYWTPPGGGVEPGETVEEAIVREVLEETNMRVLKQRAIGYQEVSESHRLTVQVRAVCIVEPVGPFVADAATDDDGEGVTAVKLIDPKDIKQYFDWGEIGDHVLERSIELKEML